MKILCPIDFSKTSMNAVDYILDYTKNREEIYIEVLHCIQSLINAPRDSPKGNLEVEKAELLLDLYTDKISAQYPHVKIGYSVTYGYSDTYIAERAKETNANMIVIGSEGLDHFKNMTVGSVTEHIVHNTTVPVLCIPKGTKFNKLDNVALAIDEKQIDHPSIFGFFNNFLMEYKPKLHIIQIQNESSSGGEMQYDQRINEYIDSWDIAVHEIKHNLSISNTINEYVATSDIDIFCMVHRKVNWLRKVFKNSHLKDGLFDLEYPMLIFSD